MSRITPAEEPVDDETLLWRFLHFGVLECAYTPAEQQIRHEAANIIDRLIHLGRGRRLVQWIKEAVQKCCKFYPLVYALVLCASCNNPEVSNDAYAALPTVCSIPTHLFMFLNYYHNSLGRKSWSRKHRRGISRWYTENPRYKEDIMLLAKHVTKYKRRRKFTHKKVLKSCHPKPPNNEYGFLFCYITNGLEKAKRKFNIPEVRRKRNFTSDIIEFLTDVECIKNSDDEQEVIKVIMQWDLSWEHVPTKMLKRPSVWRTLIMKEMPMTALIRNLGKAASLGLLQPGSDEEKKVCSRLEDIDIIAQSNLHPINIISALEGYRRGQSEPFTADEENVRRWPINDNVVKSLYTSYVNALGDRTPIGKRILLAININMALDDHVVGKRWLSCKQAAVAMTMVFIREEISTAITFGRTARKFDFQRRPDGSHDVEDALERIRTLRDVGETSFRVPFEYEHPFDAIIIMTDTVNIQESRTIKRCLNEYKDRNRNSTVKCITVCFKRSKSVADPNDQNMLDVIGVDACAVEVIQNFICGYKEEMRELLGGMKNLSLRQF